MTDKPEFTHVERGLDTLRWYAQPDGYDRWQQHAAQLHILWLGPCRAFIASLHGDTMTRQRRQDVVRYLVGQGAQVAYTTRHGQWVTYRLEADGRISRSVEPYDAGIPAAAARGHI